MKNKILLSTLGAALVAVPVLAAPGGAARGDADGNGVLTRVEAQAAAVRMFARMDANKDGKLDATDRAARRAAMQAQRFAALDANKDGSISKAEWDQHGADRAAKRAERGDRHAAAGAAGTERRDGMRGHHGQGGGHRMGGGMGGWMKADSDGDKTIGQAEFVAASLARFDRLDANKDGQVTAEERQAARTAMRAKRVVPAAPATN